MSTTNIRQSLYQCLENSFEIEKSINKDYILLCESNEEKHCMTIYLTINNNEYKDSDFIALTIANGKHCQLEYANIEIIPDSTSSTNIFKTFVVYCDHPIGSSVYRYILERSHSFNANVTVRKEIKYGFFSDLLTRKYDSYSVNKEDALLEFSELDKSVGNGRYFLAGDEIRFNKLLGTPSGVDVAKISFKDNNNTTITLKQSPSGDKIQINNDNIITQKDLTNYVSATNYNESQELNTLLINGISYTVPKEEIMVSNVKAPINSPSLKSLIIDNEYWSVGNELSHIIKLWGHDTDFHSNSETEQLIIEGDILNTNNIIPKTTSISNIGTSLLKYKSIFLSDTVNTNKVIAQSDIKTNQINFIDNSEAHLTSSSYTGTSSNSNKLNNHESSYFLHQITASSGSDINVPGTPSVDISPNSDGTSIMTFHHLKGEKGENGKDGATGTAGWKFEYDPNSKTLSITIV